MRPTLAEEWARYSNRARTPESKIAAHKIFYAGACSMLVLVMDIIESDEDAETCHHRLHDLVREMDAEPSVKIVRGTAGGKLS
jgi:hypothetical protein